jgi:DNA-binding LytR/AlgR family response regulator
MPPINKDESRQPEWEALLSNMQASPAAYKTRFLIRRGEIYVTVFTLEIAYFVIDKKTTYAVTENNNRHVVDETLDELEGVLNPLEFFRLNRQCIANIRSIDKVYPYFHRKLRVELMPPLDTKMIVSREKTAALKQWFDW